MTTPQSSWHRSSSTHRPGMRFSRCTNHCAPSTESMPSSSETRTNSAGYRKLTFVRMLIAGSALAVSNLAKPIAAWAEEPNIDPPCSAPCPASSSTASPSRSCPAPSAPPYRQSSPPWPCWSAAHCRMRRSSTAHTSLPWTAAFRRSTRQRTMRSGHSRTRSLRLHPSAHLFRATDHTTRKPITQLIGSLHP